MDVELVNPNQITTRAGPKKRKLVKSFLVFSLVTIAIVAVSALRYEKLDLGPSKIGNLKIVMSQVRMTQKPTVEQDGKTPCGDACWLSPAEIRNFTGRRWREGKPSLEAAAREYVLKHKAFTIKPDSIKFLDSVNPCWLHGTSSHLTSRRHRHCLPYFYILAFAKCATTDLYNKLLAHPLVSSTCNKEPHWWGRRRFQPKSNRDSFLQYLSCFDKLARKTYPSSTQLIIGDGSPDNLWGNTKIITESASNFSGTLSELTRAAIQEYRLLPAHLIHQFTPQARYIISMREPGERLYSDYLHMNFHSRSGKGRGVGRKAGPSHFHKGVQEQIRLYKECLDVKKDPRYCAYAKSVRTDRSDSRVRVWVGLYVVYLKDLFSLVPRDQVKLIYFDDYITNRTGVLADTLTFLGLESSPAILKRMDVGISNPRRKVFKEEMWESTRKMLDEFYRPFNLELADFLKNEKYRFDYEPS